MRSMGEVAPKATEGVATTTIMGKALPRTYERARELRWSMTEPERALWFILRRSQLKLRFRRQHPIGLYVLDFYCPSARLCVEVDGPVHLEPDQIERDGKRDAWLKLRGISVIRFTAAEVTDRPAMVVAKIAQAATPSVAEGDTSPTASP